MKGLGKYYDGHRPLSVAVAFEREENILVISDLSTKTIIARWPISNIVRDADQNVAIVFKNIDDVARLEVIDGKIEIYKTSRLHIEKDRSFFNVFILLGGIFTLLVIFWLIAPYASRKIATRISFAEEKRWSKKLELAHIAGYELCQTNVAAQNALNKIIQRLYPQVANENSDDIKVSVVNSQIENAFAYPGGQIFLFRPIIERSSSPEELAGVISHEISHVVQRHTLRMLINSAFFTAVFHFIGGDFSSLFALDPSTVLGIATLSFDRDMESEADQEAIQRLIKAQINPAEFVKFFKRVETTSTGLSFLSTHPSDKERIRVIENSQISFSIPILSESEWIELKNYCKNN